MIIRVTLHGQIAFQRPDELLLQPAWFQYLNMGEPVEQQRQDLVGPEPLAIDPETRQTYVLLRKEAYDRLKAALALDEYNPDEGTELMNEVMAEDDANDPLLES